MVDNIIYGNIIFFIIFILGFVFWQSRKDKIDNLTVTLLTVVLLFVLFSMYAPKLFTQYSSSIIFDENTGVIGDTIGGIMNPFISIAAVIVTGMAFYAQYRANEMLRKQFELQKFETQFYEMLRLHKENVNEIEVKVADGKEIIKGRKVFAELKKELELLLDIMESDLQTELNQELYSKIYDAFFKGYKEEILWNTNWNYIFKNDLRENEETENDKKIDEFRSFIDKKITLENILQMNIRPAENSLIQKIWDIGLKIPLLKGHQSYLAHYFRHLFYTVKFVVNQDKKLISEEQKLGYLKMLRAQLSHYEQIMLFYNWLGGERHGEAWENKENQFFTKYKMIHNLWYFELYKDKFLRVELKCLIRKYKQLNRKDDLFEIGDDIDKNYS